MSKLCSHIRLFSQIILRAACCAVALFIFSAIASAATFTVDTTADDAALNACTDAAANDCSLRGAISNANSLAGADTINFDAAVFSSARTIAFDDSGSNPSSGKELIINSDLTISGPGAGILTVKGSVGYGIPIFNISGGTVSINNLKLTGGSGREINSNGSLVNCGGAIYMTGGTVTVAGSTFSGNSANYGGAVYLNGGSLAVTGSTISNNDIGTRGQGGAIYLNSGAVTITDSSISNNVARIAGGIYNAGGAINITNSTVSGNIAQPLVTYSADNRRVDYYGWGGGIYNVGGTLTVTNSTISSNRADGYNSNVATEGGGGIYNFDSATAIIVNSTITGNYGQLGGGIKNRNSAVNSVTLSNSIVAGNSASDGTSDIYGAAIGDYNLVQDSAAALSGTHNITGLDPKLGALANNGGPTLTNALLQGSPAIDAGDPGIAASPTSYDQRGAGFPRVRNGRIDIGAYESDTYQSGSSLSVNTTADHDDGDCGISDCTLREAVKYAAAGNVINVNPTGTVKLTGGEIAVNKNLSINGATTAPGTLISGEDTSRIFYIRSANASNITVNFSGLTLTRGNAVGTTGSGNGGAVYIDRDSIVNITNSTLSGNNATGVGGALYIESTAVVNVTNSSLSGNKAAGNAGAVRNAGKLTVTNCTFSGNSSGGSGGAIRNGGTLTVSNSAVFGNNSVDGGGIYNVSAGTLTNSTVSGNTATGSGGGIYNSSTLSLTSATVAFNTATTSGGGAANSSAGTVNLLNTLIAKNTNAAAPDFSGAISSSSIFNLIGDGTGMTGITNAAVSLAANGFTVVGSGNQIGTSAAPIDPLLDSTLKLNGGTTATLALLVNSPAIDKGSDTNATDQRGYARPVDLAAYANAAGGNAADIGAFEMQLAAPTAALVTVSGRVITSRKPMTHAKVRLTDGAGQIRYAYANAFGYYRFTDVVVGETYIFNASLKGYEFAPQVVYVTEDVQDLNFSGN